MSQAQKLPPLAVPQPPEFSAEDWFIIDDVLNRVARVLRELEKEQQQTLRKEATNQPQQIR